MSLIIRNEQPQDYDEVENLTREAFWNLYTPGASEHYLVNIMRNSTDFIKELAYVAIKDKQIVANIMYTKSYIIDQEGISHHTITFAPLSVLPKYQKQSIAKLIFEESKTRASELGYNSMVIFGYPNYYCKFGFESAKKFNICSEDGKYPYAMLALELKKGALEGIGGKLKMSNVFDIDQKKVEEFDKKFPEKQKVFSYTQTAFEIASSAYLY